MRDESARVSDSESGAPSAPRASPAHALRGMRGADGATSRCRARYCASLLRLLRACVERGRSPRVGPARLIRVGCDLALRAVALADDWGHTASSTP